MREKYADWISLLLAVNARCVSAQHAAAIPLDDPRSLLAAAHFVRLLASVQSSVILLEHGLLPQAKSLLRVSLESLFALAAVQVKPDMALALAESQEADKRIVADRMLRWQDSGLKEAVASRITEEELRTYLASKVPEIKTFKLAEAAGMTDWYLTLYSLLSFSAHAAVSDLTSHLVTNLSGDVIGFKSEPEVDEQHATWAYAIEIELRALSSFADVFNLTGYSMDEERAHLHVLSTRAN